MPSGAPNPEVAPSQGAVHPPPDAGPRILQTDTAVMLRCLSIPRLPVEITLAVVAAVLLALPGGASAQSQGILPRASQLPGSTRAMALGDAYPTTSGHADALFYHPSLLTGASGFGLDVQRWSATSSSATIAGAFAWMGGGVGVGLRTLQYSAAGSGDLAAPAGQDHLFEYGPEPVSERIATIGYARRAFFDISLGVGVDLVDERVGGDRHGVMLVDLSAARQVGPVRVALTVNDLGDKPILDSGAGPSRVVLGAGTYGRQLGPLDYGFAAKVGVDDDQLVYGGGLEIGYWPIQGRTFVARFGFEDVPDDSDAAPFTTGLAFWGDDVTIEWAFRPFSGADEGGTHRFGVRWR